MSDRYGSQANIPRFTGHRRTFTYTNIEQGSLVGNYGVV